MTASMNPDFLAHSLFNNNGTMTDLSDFSDFVEKNQLLIGGLVMMLFSSFLTYFSTLFENLSHWVKQTLWNTIMANLEIRGEDASYRALTLFLHEKKLLKNTNNLTVNTHAVGRAPQNGYFKTIVVFSPGTGTHHFTYKGRKIWMDKKVNENSINMNQSITLRTFGKNDVLKELVLEAKKHSDTREGGVEVWTPSSSNEGSWMKADTNRSKRSLSSVVLDNGKADLIERDLKEFLDSENWYKNRGLNYRRGYLFYGPPGGGKSSILLALSSHFNLSLYSLSLSDKNMDDGKLQKLLCSVPFGSAVVLEDVDCVFTDRTTTGKTLVTFSGLLNAIDGVTASEGRVLFLTTNHKDKLDEALIRPGRVDCEIYFEKASTEQIRQMFLNFYEDHKDKKELESMADEISRKIPSAVISMAKLQGHFLRNKFSPQQSVKSSSVLLQDESVSPSTHPVLN